MTKLERSLFLIYAAMLSVIGMLASDMYLPALDTIRNHFLTDVSKVGLSISIYMAGFAIAQLFYGALSDQVGRKNPLLVGITLFILGTLGCLYAENIEQFLASRLLQSIGVCAAYILWQPMIIDLFEGEKAQKYFTMIMAFGAISPAIAPLAGGFLTEYFGWESIFWTLVGFAVLLLFWTAFIYQETLKLESRTSFSSKAIVLTYLSFFQNRFFLGYAIAISSGITLYLVFLTMLPFVLSNIGYSANEIGLMYLPIAISFICGAEIAKRIYSKLDDAKIMNIGIFFIVTGATALTISLLLHDVNSAWKIITPFTLITFGNGFLLPTGSAYLMKHFENNAGGCASSMGFLTTFLAFLSISIASLLFDALNALAISYTISGFTVILIIAYLVGRNADDSKIYSEDIFSNQVKISVE